MADNVTISAGTGTTIAADDISGALHQRIKLTWGVDGSAVDTSATNPLPVSLPSATVTALTPPAAISGFATEASLASVLAKLSADPATQTTLALILAKIEAAPATAAKQDALAALIGEVSATPTSLTLLDRLKSIQTALTGSLAVTGTFWQATQPVSASALPLPSGASTEATLSTLNGKVPALGQAAAGSSLPVVLPTAQITTLTPPAAITGFATETTLAAASAKLPAALGQTTKSASMSVALASNQDALPITDNAGSLTVDNAGTFAVQAAQSGTWTVQPGNTANTTAWKVDGSAVTQPVSIATAPALVASSARIGKTTIRNAADAADIDPLAESTFTARIGEVQATPTSFTLLDRVKAIVTALGQPFQAGGTIGNLPSTVDTNSGNKSGSTLRFVLATDQPALTTAMPVKAQRSATGTVTRVATSTASATLIASNSARIAVVIYNDSAAVLYIKCAATASATSKTYTCAAGGTVEVTIPYTGVIDGILSSGSGNADCTEFT